MGGKYVKAVKVEHQSSMINILPRSHPTEVGSSRDHIRLKVKFRFQNMGNLAGYLSNVYASRVYQLVHPGGSFSEV